MATNDDDDHHHHVVSREIRRRSSDCSHYSLATISIFLLSWTSTLIDELIQLIISSSLLLLCFSLPSLFRRHAIGAVGRASCQNFYVTISIHSHARARIIISSQRRGLLHNCIRFSPSITIKKTSGKVSRRRH